MMRRTFIGLLPATLATAGCLDTPPSEFVSDDGDDEIGPQDNGNTDDTNGTKPDGEGLNEDGLNEDGLDEGGSIVVEMFEEFGLEVLDAEVESDLISIDIQTTGDLHQDIEMVAGAYATVAADVDRNLRVRSEDRGLTVDTFEIQHEWATDFAAGDLTDQEYFDKINETTSQ